MGLPHTYCFVFACLFLLFSSFYIYCMPSLVTSLPPPHHAFRVPFINLYLLLFATRIKRRNTSWKGLIDALLDTNAGVVKIGPQNFNIMGPHGTLTF